MSINIFKVVPHVSRDQNLQALLSSFKYHIDILLHISQQLQRMNAARQASKMATIDIKIISDPVCPFVRPHPTNP